MLEHNELGPHLKFEAAYDDAPGSHCAMGCIPNSSQPKRFRNILDSLPSEDSWNKQTALMQH